MTNYEKLINTLKEVFMLDKAELDFGIYRIMNQKRKDIEQFLEVDLIPQVQKVLAESLSVDKQAIQKELDDTIKAALTLGADPDSLSKVQQLKVRLGEAADLVGLENEVFSLLANFFKRYFDNGDFISMRRYKKDVYAIPYEGEEVKLHWANADQYYIKTSEYFKNYRFKLNNGKSVVFELIEASTEQNNNKTQGDKERRFSLYTKNPCEQVGDEFIIYFTYEPTDKKVKQTDLLADAFETLKSKITSDFLELLSLRPTEKEKQRTLLQKHLLDYTARNTFDYFIHKDLGDFLTRELDFYIKNEVLFIDDLNTRDEQEFLKQLSKIKAIKKIGEKVITFLAQLENFQKKLWLKIKMVVECNYCITLERVPEELYPEIAANQKQIDEWVRLFAIDEIKKVKTAGIFSTNTTGFSNPLTIDFLKHNPFLVLDTAFFDEIFKWKLIGSIENFDEQCDGLLIHSMNFHALMLIKQKYFRKAKTVYIDPPYNTEANAILYKNNFKHSSWLSLMYPLLEISKEFELPEVGVHVIAIDKAEEQRLAQLCENVWNDKVVTPISVIHNPGGTMGRNFSGNGEFALFIHNDDKKVIAQEIRSDNPDVRELMNTAKGKTDNYLRISGKTCFYPIIVKDDEIISFGEICSDDFHPKRNIIREDGSIEVFPIDSEGVERKWVLGRDTVESCKNQLFIKKDKDNIIRIFRSKDEINYKTVWTNSKYSAKKYGTELLGDIIPLTKTIDPLYPKSIFLVEDCLHASLNNNQGLVIDYFAGSGTTGHAVLNINRENKKNKYILVEMGEYFNTVTKPRIQKVIYSKDWRDGKPISREGISHCFKYMRLEGYEDTLNNLEMKRTVTQQRVLDLNPAFKEGYMLNYMLDVETQGSLLNLEWFENPFNCYLNITRNNEMQPTKVDLVETFNYLIGLVVENYAVPKEGYVVVTGKNLTGEKILVIWRNCNLHNSASLNEFLSKSKYNPLDNEFDRIYVNGDNNVENLKIGDERWKVVLIEEEFKNRMFED